MPQRTKTKAAKPTKAAKKGEKKAEKKDGGPSKSRVKSASKAERRMQKLERRKKEKRMITADMWAMPAPSHLVARLDMPKVKSKYQSYFEFADNTEKKQKKLEFQITDDPVPPPGFAFVPIGDPALTNACKELSRERDAMIFIVSVHKEDHNKISEQMYRTGYHFREVIVEEAREIVGETIISKPAVAPGFIEPIPDSQEDINTQADAALRDLFPRIPNIDRTMIIEHAFQKGALFHGEPTVGLQSNIPLSRRVQLAVLAHIRHNHTRYDKLLKETSWMNARKAVEPVCLDILVKWRGDEETGRDQMDEILREVVIITDSEGDDDSSDDDSSDDDEEGEATSASSTEEPSPPPSRNQPRPMQSIRQSQAGTGFGPGATETAAPKALTSTQPGGVSRSQSQRDKRAQRGFKRYQAAWDDAVTRNHVPATTSSVRNRNQLTNISTISPRESIAVPVSNSSPLMTLQRARPQPNSPAHDFSRVRTQEGNRVDGPYSHSYSQQRTAPANLLRREEVIVRPLLQNPTYHEGTMSSYVNASRQFQNNGPPQVARAPPAEHGLQDMLLRSIETTSSDGRSQRIDDAPHPNSAWAKPPMSRSLIENRRISPLSQPVIVIEDDSPQGKRRRVIREGSSGYMPPLPIRDQDHHSRPQPRGSPMMQSYIRPVEPQQRSVEYSESRQGLFQSLQKDNLSPIEADRLGVYDARREAFSAAYPHQSGRPEAGYTTTGRGEQDMRRLDSVNPPLQSSHDVNRPSRPIINHRRETLRRAEYENAFRPVLSHSQVDHFRRNPSPELIAQSRVSRPYDASHRSAASDQDFVQSFSQSHLHEGPSRPDHGLTLSSDRFHHLPITQGNHRQEHDIYPARARSPARYLDRPVHSYDTRYQSHDQRPLPQRYGPPDPGRPVFRDLNIPAPTAEPPTFVRTVDPKRQVIVIE